MDKLSQNFNHNLIASFNYSCSKIEFFYPTCKIFRRKIKSKLNITTIIEEQNERFLLWNKIWRKKNNRITLKVLHECQLNQNLYYLQNRDFRPLLESNSFQNDHQLRYEYH
jgi:hypothetical protein